MGHTAFHIHLYWNTRFRWITRISWLFLGFSHVFRIFDGTMGPHHLWQSQTGILSWPNFPPDCDYPQPNSAIESRHCDPFWNLRSICWLKSRSLLRRSYWSNSCLLVQQVVWGTYLRDSTFQSSSTTPYTGLCIYTEQNKTEENQHIHRTSLLSAFQYSLYDLFCGRKSTYGSSSLSFCDY